MDKDVKEKEESNTDPNSIDCQSLISLQHVCLTNVRFTYWNSACCPEAS